MTCRWCGNENVLNRPRCPHCWEDVERLEQAFAPPPPEDEADGPPLDGLRSAAAQVGKSIAVSAVAVLMLVGGGKHAQSYWPPGLWPRPVPKEAEAATAEGPGPEPDPSGSAGPDEGLCVQRGGSVTDPRGETFDRWYCTVERPGDVHAAPDPTASVTGDLQESDSWFVCQVEGALHPDGGSTWFYTQADEPYSDGGWGYFPAGRVNSAWISWPVPGLPSCSS